jgi:hypothetical protein
MLKINPVTIERPAVKRRSAGFRRAAGVSGNIGGNEAREQVHRGWRHDQTEQNPRRRARTIVFGHHLADETSRPGAKRHAHRHLRSPRDGALTT